MRIDGRDLQFGPGRLGRPGDLPTEVLQVQVQFIDPQDPLVLAPLRVGLLEEAENVLEHRDVLLEGFEEGGVNLSIVARDRACSSDGDSGSSR